MYAYMSAHMYMPVQQLAVSWGVVLLLVLFAFGRGKPPSASFLLFIILGCSIAVGAVHVWSW